MTLQDHERLKPAQILFTLAIWVLSVAAGLGCAGMFAAGCSAVLFSSDWARTHALAPGQEVTVVADHDAETFLGAVPATRDEFPRIRDQGGSTPTSRVGAGTPATVVLDLGDDDDTANRLVAIKLAAGRQAGTAVTVPRGLLRER